MCGRYYIDSDAIDEAGIFMNRKYPATEPVTKPSGIHTEWVRQGETLKSIKKLEIEELKTVYKKYIRNDFPRSERRPFSSMEKLTREERYASYGYYDGDRLTAYACYILTGDSQFALLAPGKSGSSGRIFG